MAKRIAGKLVCALLMISFGFCCLSFFSLCPQKVSAETVIAEAEEGDSLLSDEVMRQAMLIISSAGEHGLSEEDIQQLKLFGLSASQIEMLQSLASVEDDTDTESYGDWNVQNIDQSENPAVLFLWLGIAAAAVLIGVLLVTRRIYFSFRLK